MHLIKPAIVRPQIRHACEPQHRARTLMDSVIIFICSHSCTATLLMHCVAIKINRALAFFFFPFYAAIVVLVPLGFCCNAQKAEMMSLHFTVKLDLNDRG